MSPNVSSFVGDLVEMAKAFEALPQVQSELADARSTIDAQAATIQRLELKLLERANRIDELNKTVRELEVSRDDAELRFLERDDALGVIRRALEGVVGSVRETLQATEPPVPAVTPTPEVAPTPDPLPDGATTSDTPTSETPSPSEGQSEVGPTVSIEDSNPSPSETVPSSSVADTSDAKGPSFSSEGVSVSSDPIAPSSPDAPSPIAGEAATPDASGQGSRTINSDTWVTKLNPNHSEEDLSQVSRASHYS